MKCGVLPDVESGQKKAEDFQCAPHGFHVRFRETLRAGLHEQAVQKRDVRGEFQCIAIKLRAVAQLRELAGRDVERQTRDHQLDELPPRLFAKLHENRRGQVAK